LALRTRLSTNLPFSVYILLKGKFRQISRFSSFSENKNNFTYIHKLDYFFVTVYPREIDTDQVDKLRNVGFNDHEILEAAYVAGFFNYTNRWVSTIAATPNKEHYNHNR
jgi:hypothetical protein